MSKKRILGNDRALMMLCKQARRYWEYYSPAYKQTKEDSHCNVCGYKVDWVEVDHNPPLGKRPYTFNELADYLNRMFFGPVQGLCKKHHKEKTTIERKKRIKNDSRRIG